MFLFGFYLANIWATHLEPVSRHMFFWKFYFSWQWEMNLASLKMASFHPPGQWDFWPESSAADISLNFCSLCQSLAAPSDQIILWRWAHDLLCMCRAPTLILLHSATQQPQSGEVGLATTQVLLMSLPRLRQPRSGGQPSSCAWVRPNPSSLSWASAPHTLDTGFVLICAL